MLHIKWKDEELNQSFFCDVKKTADNIRVLKDKASPYVKYRTYVCAWGVSPALRWLHSSTMTLNSVPHFGVIWDRYERKFVWIFLLMFSENKVMKLEFY